jgi:ubiquinone/menaquinone biosynthesis C-methylase UbiE
MKTSSRDTSSCVAFRKFKPNDPSVVDDIGAPSRKRAIEAERMYFDSLATGQGDFNPFAPRGWATIRNQFERWLGSRENLRVLDVGSGTGHSRQLYMRRAAHYLGLDLSGESIERARKLFPESEWVVGNACQLNFDDGSFDAVAFSSVLHHIPEFSQALDEAWRVLRPGGVVMAFDPNLLHPAMAMLRWPKSPFYSPQGVSPNECPLLPTTLRREFSRAGFVRVHQRCQSNIPYRSVAPRWANTLLRAYNFADRMWALSGLDRWFGTFVLTFAEKPASFS